MAFAFGAPTFHWQLDADLCSSRHLYVLLYSYLFPFYILSCAGFIYEPTRRLYGLTGEFRCVQSDSAVWCILSCSSDRCTWLCLSQWCRSALQIHHPTHTRPTQRRVLYKQRPDRTQVATVLSLHDGCKVQGLLWRFLLTAQYPSWHYCQRRNLPEGLGALRWGSIFVHEPHTNLKADFCIVRPDSEAFMWLRGKKNG